MALFAIVLTGVVLVGGHADAATARPRVLPESVPPVTLPPASAARASIDLPAAAGEPLDDALQTDARRFGWPLVIGILIVAFLLVQGRADRHDRKLADAPLDQGERLRFR